MSKRIKDLDDVDNILKQNTVDDVIERKAARKRKTLSQKKRNQALQRDGLILSIPAIIVVLMIIIVILDRNGGPAGPSAPTPVETEAQAVASSSVAESTPEETQDPTILAEYNDNVLAQFFDDYFTARLSGDVDKLMLMTGVTNQTDQQKSTLKSQLDTQAGYIEKYQDITIYATTAIEPDSKLVFLTYNVKFRRSDTLAPGIMYCYVIVNDKNEFEIVQNMSAKQTQFVNNYINEHEEATNLINSVNSKLLDAISGDSRLAVIYDAIQTGRIYTDSQSEIDSEVSLISVETEAAVTEASTEGTSDTSTNSGNSTDNSSSGTSKNNSGTSTTKANAETTAAAKTTAAESAAAIPDDQVISVDGDPGSSPQTVTNAADSPNADADAAVAANAGGPAAGSAVIEAGDGPVTAD